MGVISCGTTMLDQGAFVGLSLVDWDTTVKTASFTAVSGNGYFVNSTSTAVTVTLPISPSVGNLVAIKDYANQVPLNNNINIARNGSNIDGQASDFALVNKGGSITLFYVDATKGWVVIDSGQESDIGVPSFVTATGGTVSTSGNFKYHKFTGPGTFSVSSAGNIAGSDKIQILMAAGGGGGGNRYGGGGGAGGVVLTPSCGIPTSVSPFPISIGAGGLGVNGSRGLPGSNTTGFSLSTIGGGGGRHASINAPEQAGGSGGGTGQYPGTSFGVGTQPIQPGNSGTFGFGNPSGNGVPSPINAHSGGGGAGAAGGSSTPTAAGAGGTGKDATPIFPAPLGGFNPTGTYGGGGGGGSAPGSINGAAGPGGGGGTGSPGSPGTINTGGGGGGSTGNVNTGGGNGGSGIVIIKYKFQ